MVTTQTANPRLDGHAPTSNVTDGWQTNMERVMSRIKMAKHNAEAMILSPPRMSQMAERIGTLCGEAVSLQELHELSRLLDRAAFTTNGPGLSGVLIGLLAGLELAHGIETTDPVGHCQVCSEVIGDDLQFCSSDCQRKQRQRDNYHARISLAGHDDAMALVTAVTAEV